MMQSDLRRLWKAIIRRLLRVFGSHKMLLHSGWLEVKRNGFHWRLDMKSDISREMIVSGYWEPITTDLIKKLVRPGMNVLDIGANFGYFTLLLARCVGEQGHVWAFEPVETFRDQLIWHLKANQLSNRVTVLPYGLSDKDEHVAISVGESSATLHWTDNEAPRDRPTINLRSLDTVLHELDIDTIDFVKIDIDGHEPNFLRGASQTLSRFHPTMLLEFNQTNLYVRGDNVLDQLNLLKSLGYSICHEATMAPYTSELSFLLDCGNYGYSCNALAVFSTIPATSISTEGD